MQQYRWRGRRLWPVAVIASAIFLLFFFNWLGSEQPQKWVEMPIELSPEEGAAAKRR